MPFHGSFHLGLALNLIAVLVLQQIHAQENTYSGELQLVVEDYFDRPPVHKFFILLDGATMAVPVQLLPGLSIDESAFASRQRVMLSGQFIGSALQISKMNFITRKLRRGASLSSPKKGPRQVAVIVTQFSDGADAGDNVNLARDMVFGRGNSHQLSVKSRFDECSNGQLTMPSQTVFGPVVLSYSSTSLDASCSGYDLWAQDAFAKLQGCLTGYDIFAYVLPPETSISACAIGRGHVCLGGCTPGLNFPRTWIKASWIRPDVFAHEFGHNFGLHHAGIGVSEYADTSSTMGFAEDTQKCFNGANYRYFGWADGKVKFITPFSSSLSAAMIYTTQNVNLTAISELGLNGMYYIVQITTANATYFIEYRAATKGDSGLSSAYAGRTGVVRWNGDLEKTWRLASLGDGETFRVGGVTITQTSHTESTASVSITYATRLILPTIRPVLPTFRPVLPTIGPFLPFPRPEPRGP